jgi:carboxypeptidase C (cathepsin A)
MSLDEDEARFTGVPRGRASLLSLLPAAFVAACSPAGSPSEPAPSVEVPAEAGYIEVPPQVSGAADRARMFYAFRPADAHPERAPLLVFFDGGPGTATSGLLLPFGTGPKTLRVDDLGAGPVDNPASFTRFANLLYLDERDTGFSYELGEDVEAWLWETGAIQP